MADTKISALPASTTPLAGTEVLPIVQGGVTKQVSVANLTEGRAVSATQITLTAGNLIMGTAGKGIDFSADPNALGMTSELLDDYEEGTWAPAAGSGVTVVGTFSSYGTYTKIGRLVMVTGFMESTSTIGCSGAGQLVNNLPFANLSGELPLGQAMTQNTSVFCPIYPSGGTNLITANVTLSSTPYIFFSITYTTI